MSPSVSALLLTAGLFTAYPGFGDDGIMASRPLRAGGSVETIVDRGPILELVVGCGGGAAIVTYSKIEKKYCTPRFACGMSLDAVIAETCRR